MGLVAGGPAGVAAGAVAAGAIGAGEAALIEAGFPRQTLQNVQTHMTPGASALVVLIEQVWLENLDRILSQFGGEVVRQTLTDAMMESMVRTQAGS